MQASPTRTNGSPMRNGGSPHSPPLGKIGALEAVADLTQMLLGLGIDCSVPTAGHTGSKVRLPLQYFDNTDMERNTPQGWVELCGKKFGAKRANAIVLISDAESGAGLWRLGKVFRWDAKSSCYYAPQPVAAGAHGRAGLGRRPTRPPGGS